MGFPWCLLVFCSTKNVLVMIFMHKRIVLVKMLLFVKFQYCTLICAFLLAGKFVTIHGTVVRVSNVKPLVMGMAFSCNLCGETQV